MDLYGLLKHDTGRAKAEFYRLNLQLRLTPVEANPRPYFTVQGQCDLAALAFFIWLKRSGALVGRYLEEQTS